MANCIQSPLGNIGQTVSNFKRGEKVEFNNTPTVTGCKELECPLPSVSNWFPSEGNWKIPAIYLIVVLITVLTGRKIEPTALKLTVLEEMWYCIFITILMKNWEKKVVSVSLNWYLCLKLLILFFICKPIIRRLLNKFILELNSMLRISHYLKMLR